MPLYGRDKYFRRLLIRLIVKLNSKIIYYRTSAHPHQNILPVSKEKIFYIKRKFKSILGKIIYFPLEILNADKVVIGGYYEYKKLRNKEKAIFAHNFDYDNFLEISRNLNSYNLCGKNLLFLDEDFPCHTDYFRSGFSSEIDEIGYFKEMSECLLKLGKIFNLNPIIKLHPRANIARSSKLYDVEIAYEETAKIVSSSDLIVAHCSTSIQLAVLFYKPIILISQ